MFFYDLDGMLLKTSGTHKHLHKAFHQLQALFLLLQFLVISSSIFQHYE